MRHYIRPVINVCFLTAFMLRNGLCGEECGAWLSGPCWAFLISGRMPLPQVSMGIIFSGNILMGRFLFPVPVSVPSGLRTERKLTLQIYGIPEMK